MPDLANFEDINKPVLMPIEDPSTGEPWVDQDGNVAALMLYSRDSKIAKEEAFRQVDESRKKNLNDESAAKTDANNRLLYAKCVHSIINIQEDGKDLESDVETVMALFKKAPWLYSQVIDFVEKRANFIKRR